MPITKHNFTVRRVEELADTMRSAFRIAQSGRKGPVLVDIPKDVTAAVCEFTPKKPEPIRTVTTFNAEQVKWAADLINEMCIRDRPKDECVVDDANILSDSTTQTIVDLNNQLQSSCNGAQTVSYTHLWAVCRSVAFRPLRPTSTPPAPSGCPA